MHWSDVVAQRLSERGSKHIVSTGITPSGEFHIGHLREILTGDMITKAAKKADLDVEFVFIVDSADPLRKVYSFLDDSYSNYIGHQLKQIPPPDEDGRPDMERFSQGISYADHFLEPFKQALQQIDVRPRFIDNFDEWDVQRENTSLDKNFKRDPYEYMRLHDTERTLLKVKQAQMFKKGKDGKYERLNLQSDGEGTLVLTTRRLTFSILSTRASLSTFVPIVGRYNYLNKERDFIKYSIPSFLLSGTQITGNFDAKTVFLIFEEFLEWEIKNEGIKFKFIPDKKETVIGGFEFLDDYILRSEKSDAIPKLFVRNINTNKEEEIKISDEPIGVPGISLMQRDTNTTMIRVGWESMATPGRVYEYDIVTKEKKLVKETEIPSGHDPSKYVVERIKARSHDGRMVPISLVRLKDSKQDGKSKVLLYSYGAYKHSVNCSFSASRFCLIDRGIIFAIAHIRGGGDLGDSWHTEGKKKLKKNTFLDYVACANHLIEQRYTYRGGICFYGGSAGGLTGGAVANLSPDLFFGMLLLVPFVDTMTTMLNEKLPLTPGEWEMWGNPIKSKEYFEYILSYSPYNNIKKKDYPPMLITTSLFDNRVLYSEPVKYIAKLRDLKTDNNNQLLKCKMEAAGHGGMSGRDNAITELAEEYSFILKSAKILK